jgi:protoporphyrinogen oxidase
LVGASQCLSKSVLAATPRFYFSSLPVGTADPIQIALAASNADFNGDDINRPHDILWNKDDYLKSKGGRPKVSETCEVVIVGGGMSGLLSAYYLSTNNAVLLEQAAQFGGNAKGEDFQGSRYSLGAAYVNVPDPGSRVEKLFADLGISDQFRREVDTNVLWKNKITPEFWSGQFDADKAALIEKFEKKLKDILENHFPDIPCEPGDGVLSRQELNKLDNISFIDWMNQTFPEMAEEVLEYCQLYAWSSFGGSIDELSAAQMLNFVAAEAGGIMAMPGGNAGITQALLERMRKRWGPDRLRAGAFVIDIRAVDVGVVVVYEDAARNLKALKANQCIVASSKLVAKYLIDDLPDDQRRAMENIRYRGYIVANVILNKTISSPSLDLYCLEGTVPDSPRAMTPPDRAFTDTCFGTWAQSENVKQSVLTIYKALPMDGAQQFLFNPTAFSKNKKVILDGLSPLLNALGAKSSDVAGIRMTRWGHSMPLAETGFISGGAPEILSRPYQGRVHFANQDNWANPAFETAESVAFEAVSRVAKNLRTSMI